MDYDVKDRTRVFKQRNGYAFFSFSLQRRSGIDQFELSLNGIIVFHFQIVLMDRSIVQFLVAH